MYKVIRVVDDRLYSAMIYPDSQDNPSQYLQNKYEKLKDWSIEYEVGEWAYPIIPNSHIFVFSNLDWAKTFAGSSANQLHIYECEIGERYTSPYNIVDILSCRPESLINYWTGKRHLINVYIQSVIPPGTTMTNKVKLLGRVND